VGGGNSAAQAALGLAGSGAVVNMIASGYRPDTYLAEKIEAEKLITVHQGVRPWRIDGGERVERIVFKGKDGGEEQSVECEAIVVEIGLIPNSGLLKELAVINAKGEIEIDTHCRTGLPGLFAAGDVTSIPGKRMIIAAGEGAKAMLGVAEYLSSKK